jgi:hypothetical protein
MLLFIKNLSIKKKINLILIIIKLISLSYKSNINTYNYIFLLCFKINS